MVARLAAAVPQTPRPRAMRRPALEGAEHEFLRTQPIESGPIHVPQALEQQSGQIRGVGESVPLAGDQGAQALVQFLVGSGFRRRLPADVEHETERVADIAVRGRRVLLDDAATRGEHCRSRPLEIRDEEFEYRTVR
jgi:hypothetical protein